MEVLIFDRGALVRYVLVADSRISYVDIFVRFCEEKGENGILEIGHNFISYAVNQAILFMAGPVRHEDELTVRKRLVSTQ